MDRFEFEITPEEKIVLFGLAQHPGFEVLNKMLKAACAKANDDIVSVNPISPNYIHEIQVAHQRARTISEFCYSLGEALVNCAVTGRHYAEVKEKGGSIEPSTSNLVPTLGSIGALAPNLNELVEYKKAQERNR